MRRLIILAQFLALFTITSSSLFAEVPVAYQSCVSCHGAQGEGSETTPRIGGQFDWYIISSFEKFKSGERKELAGKPHSKTSSADIQLIATYIAALKK